MVMRNVAGPLIAAWLSGCALVSGVQGVSYMNQPNPGGTVFHVPANPVPRATSRIKPARDTFVGVAVSGGGSRSATFGLAVLAQLQAQGLLGSVDAISAVSGGAIPAALFAIDGANPGWIERAHDKVSADLVLPLLARLARPTSLLTTTVTDRDRTDVLAEVFEDIFFDGHRLRFGDLGAPGSLRPSIYFNATDTTSGGTRFVFTDDTFLTQLGSDLSQYPIAWAMAASGAFPGVFNSVTLRRHALSPNSSGSTGAAISASGVPSASYTHLIDGGPSDNLGVETLIEQARRHHIELLNRGTSPNGCMLIVIDAHVPSTSRIEARQSDRRNIASMLLDLNFLDAIDTLLSHRRDDTLARLGIHKNHSVGQFDIRISPDLIDYAVAPYDRFGAFEIEYFELQGLSFEARALASDQQALRFAADQFVRRRTFTCHTWHVALGDIESIVPWQQKQGQDSWQRLDLMKYQDHQVYAYRARLARMIEQISTSYRLSGPPYCSVNQIQAALEDVARIAVRQDLESLLPVCQWFRQRGLLRPGDCIVEQQPLYRAEFAVEPIERPRDLTRTEQSASRFVRCSRPPDSPP